MRRRSCGTGRWVCSSWSRSARAREASQPPSLGRTRSASSAGETPCSRSGGPSSRTDSTTSPRAAAPRWNSSRGDRCPASRSWSADMAEERRPIIAANWKMNKTHLEAIQSVQKLSYLVDSRDAERVEIVICPPFTALRSVQTLLDSDKLPYGLGAQDVYPADAGAFTGEVSPPMLVALKAGFAIVGHSERRRLFGEDDAVVNRKIGAVVRSGMTPIVCVGETLEERDAGGTES